MRGWPFCRTSEWSSLLRPPQVLGTGGAGGGGRRGRTSTWSSPGVGRLQTWATMSRPTQTPTWTLPKCQQRLSFSWTPRTTRLSQKGAGPGDSGPSSFLVSLRKSLRLSWGEGSVRPVFCVERGSGAAPSFLSLFYFTLFYLIFWGGAVERNGGRGAAPLKGMGSFHSVAAPASEPGNKKPRGQRWKEPPGEEPARKKRGRPMTKNLDLDPGPDPGDGEA